MNCECSFFCLLNFISVENGIVVIFTLFTHPSQNHTQNECVLSTSDNQFVHRLFLLYIFREVKYYLHSKLFVLNIIMEENTLKVAEHLSSGRSRHDKSS